MRWNLVIWFFNGIFVNYIWGWLGIKRNYVNFYEIYYVFFIYDLDRLFGIIFIFKYVMFVCLDIMYIFFDMNVIYIIVVEFKKIWRYFLFYKR